MTKYEDFVKTTDLSNGDPIFYILGMLEEAGEIAGICKRVLRGDYGELVKSDAQRGNWYLAFRNEDVLLDLTKEKGDEHWYSTGLLNSLGITLNDVENINMKKLKERLEKGKIMGKGDNRESD